MGKQKTAVKNEAPVKEESPYLTTPKTLQTDLNEGAGLTIKELMKKGLGAAGKPATLHAYPADDGRLYFRFKEDFNSPKFQKDRKKPDERETTIYYELKRKDGVYSVTAIKEIKYDSHDPDRYFDDVDAYEKKTLKVDGLNRYHEVFFSQDKSELSKTVDMFTDMTSKRYDIKEIRYGTEYNPQTIYFAAPYVNLNPSVKPSK